jgi:hypothetical protein
MQNHPMKRVALQWGPWVAPLQLPSVTNVPAYLRLPINATLYDSNCHNAQATLRTIGEMSVSDVACLYANPSLRRALTVNDVIVVERLRPSWRKCGGAT